MGLRALSQPAILPSLMAAVPSLPPSLASNPPRPTSRSFHASATVPGKFYSSDPMMRSLDPYKELGVDRNASQGDIQKAYRSLLFALHPDRQRAVSGDGRTEPSTDDSTGLRDLHRRAPNGHRAQHKRPTADVNKDRLIRVLAAYELLRNPEKRRRLEQAQEWKVNWNGDYVRRESRRSPGGFYSPQGMHTEAGGTYTDPFPGQYSYSDSAHDGNAWAPPAYIDRKTTVALTGAYLLVIVSYFVVDYSMWRARQRFDSVQSNYSMGQSLPALAVGAERRQRADAIAKGAVLKKHSQ